MQRGLNEGLEKESSNGSKQTETMLTFWPAFEIKYAFVIYFVVAGAGGVSLALSVYYFNILKGFCIGFFYFVPSSSSLEIACLCLSGCDSFSQSMSHHRKYGECQAVYNFPLWKHTAESNQQQHQQYAGIHKRMLENDERYAYMHTITHTYLDTCLICTVL